jgi:hypothetical protein
MTGNSLEENDLVNLGSTLGPDGWGGIHHAVNAGKGNIIKQLIAA